MANRAMVFYFAVVAVTFSLYGCTTGDDAGTLKEKGSTSSQGPSNGDPCGNGSQLLCLPVDPASPPEYGDLFCRPQNGNIDKACVLGSCGNEYIEISADEDCDGRALNGFTCADLPGFSGGTLRCGSGCTWDTSSCIAEVVSICGDSLVNPLTEDCDNGNLGGWTCAGLGYAGGALSCNADCTLNDSQCVATPVCGNGFIENGEPCDDGDLSNGDGCSSACLIESGWSCGGNLGSISVCTPIAVCGNGSINGGEFCDGTNLAGATCSGLGFAGGSLSCNSNCTLNTSSCTVPAICGNGLINASEACDGSNLNNQTCTGLGFVGGSLSCNSNCTLNTSSCTVPPPYNCIGEFQAGTPANTVCAQNSCRDFILQQVLFRYYGAGSLYNGPAGTPVTCTGLNTPVSGCSVHNAMESRMDEITCEDGAYSYFWFNTTEGLEILSLPNQTFEYIIGATPGVIPSGTWTQAPYTVTVGGYLGLSSTNINIVVRLRRP